MAHGVYSVDETGHLSKDNYINCSKGLWSWLFTLDHKRIAILYLVALIAFFFAGGIAAIFIRLHLFDPNKPLLSPDMYNAMFTLHGVLMIFLFIVPGIPAVLGNFLLPLMIGAKDVAFPRLNLLSYWIYLLGAFVGVVAIINPLWLIKYLEGSQIGKWIPLDTGWTFYAPYSTTTGAGEGWGTILMTLAAFILGFSSILTGLNFIVTIHRLRAPGLTWFKLPVFVWGIYATSIIQVLATPVVGITLLLLIAEKVFQVGIFDPSKGGDPILYQHFFWFYSHPVVYIMVLPAFGIIGEIIPVFSRKPIFGYTAVVFSSVGIAAVSFIVWAHHMYTSGMSPFSQAFFSATTFAVAIPTAIKVFNWVSTMYKGSIKFDVSMYYAMAFVFLFMIAGTTGIFLAVLGLDIFYHDTYFVVAHFHYTIQGGAVIGLIAGLHFWFPKITGKMFNENVAKLAFWLIFIGFNTTFLPQFILGVQGMPRRYAFYLPEFEPMHRLSTFGTFINATGYALALLNLAWCWVFSKSKAPANPYNALGLEWQAPSPPPHDNFIKTPNVDQGRYDYGVPISEVLDAQINKGV
ncbi:MAG: cbb3-type cytochrome c oxidase subunit I [Deltaproteobacteria bacterium]|nr:cbb3-type cytochrome c oxidase subunit I [Deltaproteobacteria bacterium]